MGLQYRHHRRVPKKRRGLVGKYLTVWKEVIGEWKVSADINNSDLPVSES